MSDKEYYATNLAAAFLAGAWTRDGLTRRGALAMGSETRWLRRLARQVLEHFPQPPAAKPESLIEYLVDANQLFNQALRELVLAPTTPARRLFWLTPDMHPHPAAAGWSVPALVTTEALAGWLGVTPRELDWFADCRGMGADAPDGPLRHYRYQWLTKPSGGRRLLEVPKPRLKTIQRKILRDILDLIPPHDAAHGYRRGRSLISYVAPHAGRRVVLRFDLCDFFPSVHAGRVHALFRFVGYPAAVARSLTGLCTSVVPGGVAPDAPKLLRPHLPQGAPTSPALANLCAYRLDHRLAGLAASLGTAYTRYADDLAFSGGEELERSARRLQIQVGRAALEEGFALRMRKSRFMRQGVRQQLAGVVLNQHPNVRREDYDRLKATLTNCVRHGPASQNRDGHEDFRAHLAGRVAHVTQVNPARGRRLRELFERIVW